MKDQERRGLRRFFPDLLKFSIVDVLTLLVVAVGLYLGFDQAKKIADSLAEAQRNNDLSQWNSVSQQWLAMDHVFLEHPGSRDYIFGNRDLKENDPDYKEHLAVAAFVLDFMDYAVSSYSNVPNVPHLVALVHPEGWAYEFGVIFSNSPVVCRMLFEHEQGYNLGTRELARRDCKVKPAGPPPPT